MYEMSHEIMIKLFARLAALPSEWTFAVLGIIEMIDKEEKKAPTVLCGEEEELHHLGEATAGLFAITGNPIFGKFSQGMNSPANLLGSELGELVKAIAEEYSLLAEDTYTYRALMDICKIRARKEQAAK